MTCVEIQNELLLFFGSSDLPEEILQHLLQCDDCTRYQNELSGMVPGFDRADDSYPENIDVERMVAAVNADIDQSDAAKVVPIGTRFGSVWPRLIAVAAMIAIVFGIYNFSFRSGPGNYLPDYVELSAENELMAGLLDEDDYQPNESAISTLLTDYASQNPLSAGEALLEDITDEEMEYLRENFDMGDLL